MLVSDGIFSHDYENGIIYHIIYNEEDETDDHIPGISDEELNSVITFHVKDRKWLK